ncbi:hypothetical protein CPB83DRAFT_847339 [Crepidotus variabilis]|uniref:Uncharacterized protein n=1 Tax=Crepidotus variabilis TaxID=179855 RepID=A0A9P6ENE6_9AGAR|nr:hypothetical protein CPB83DRAFT_847339 [Crepidotus variabilis]
MSCLDQLDRARFHLLGVEGDVLQNIYKSDVGLQLFQWLDLQNSIMATEGNGANVIDSRISSLWREIALEQNEVPLFKNDTLEPQVQDLLSNPYFPPSKAKTHVDSLKEENALTQREVDLLRARLAALNDASKKINQSTRTLQHCVNSFEPKVRTLEERVTELSVEADTILESTTSNAHDLLLELGHSNNQEITRISTKGPRIIEPVKLDTIKDVLVETQAELSVVGANLRQKLEALDRIREIGVEKAQDLQREGARLKTAISTAEDQQEKALCERYLQEICDELQRSATGNGSHFLGNLLAEAEEQNVSEKILKLTPTNVSELFEIAWANDQASILNQEEKALDEAITSLTSMLDPLNNLQPSMSRLVAAAQEAEAILEAYGEELEDICLPDPSSELRLHPKENEDSLVEREVRRVLAQFESSRKPNATPLLVLTREDILSELRDLRANIKESEALERNQATNLTHQILARPLHPSMPDIYANSDLYPNPLFSQPKDNQTLQKRAETMGSELRDLAVTLEADVREEFAKSGTIGRLDLFVEKWTI